MKPPKYVPTKEPPKQPKGKRAPKTPTVRTFPFRVADETGQARGTDAGGWIRAGAVDLQRGNVLGTEAYQPTLARDLNVSPSQTVMHAQRIHDLLSNDNLPSTAIRRPFLFYRRSTPTQLTANKNDWAFDGGEPSLIMQRVSSNAAVNVTGLSLVTNGKHLIIVNVGAFTITFKHQDVASAAANRIISATGADIPLTPNGYLELVYDDIDARWRAGPLGTSTAPAPAAHHTTHEDGGSDEINVTGLSGLLADVQKIQVLDETVLVGNVTTLDFQGAGVTATLSGSKVIVTISGGGAGSLTVGSGTLDFGAFPGKSDAFVDIASGGVLTTSIVWAFLRPVATADHTADEHWVESLEVTGICEVNGTVRIYGKNVNNLFSALVPGPAFVDRATTNPFPNMDFKDRFGGEGTLIYGQWSVGFAWQ